MQMPKPFDASTVTPSQPQDIIPVNWYNVTITESEFKETGKKTGSFMALTFTIIEGDFKGRKVFTNLNLVNPNAQAVEIAEQNLSAICHATGVIQLSDSSQLHNIPFEIKVGMAKPTAEYPEPSNEVKGFRRAGGAKTNAAATPLTAAPPPVAAAAPAPVVAAPVAAAPAPSTPAPAAAPWAAAPAPVAEVPAPAPAPILAPVVVEPVKTMTDKAAGATYDAFIANGWTDDKMIADGYMVMIAPVAAAAPADDSNLPPWQRKPA